MRQQMMKENVSTSVTAGAKKIWGGALAGGDYNTTNYLNINFALFSFRPANFSMTF